MPVLKKALTLGFVATFVLAVAACSPTVGTPEWCTEMKDKPKGDWTANEATEFAKNCLM